MAESFESAVEARVAGNYRVALAAIRVAVRTFSRSEGANHPDTAHARLELGRILVARGDTTAGLRELATASQSLLAHRSRDTDLATLVTHACLVTAAAWRAAGHYPEARRCARAALRRAPDPGWIAAAHNELGVIGKFAGHFDEAERHYRAAKPLIQRLYGAASREMATYWHNLGGLAHARGRWKTGERAARRSVEIGRAVLPAGDLELHAHEVAYAALLDELGRHDESLPIYRRALVAYRLAEDRYEVASTLHGLAAAEHSAGRLAEARAHYTAAIAAFRACVGAAHPDVGRALHNLATLERAAGHATRANQLYARAITNLRASLGATHPTTRAAMDARSRAR
ncbi:MAG: tetratricopeptide repeat protein, partial [Kofleriaceae bacterium]